MQSGILWSWYKGLLVQSHQIICPWWPGEESPKLLTGLPVEVDGFPFVCRIPVLPDDQDVIEAVDWGSYPFWCLNPKNPKRPHMCKPQASTKVSRATRYDVRCMLRLIMEPVPVAPNPLIGKPVKLLFQPYVLHGWLDEITDYDLVCRMTEDTHISPRQPQRHHRSGGQVVSANRRLRTAHPGGGHRLRSHLQRQGHEGTRLRESLSAEHCDQRGGLRHDIDPSQQHLWATAGC